MKKQEVQIPSLVLVKAIVTYHFIQAYIVCGHSQKGTSLLLSLTNQSIKDESLLNNSYRFNVKQLAFWNLLTYNAYAHNYQKMEENTKLMKPLSLFKKIQKNEKLEMKDFMMTNAGYE